VGNIDRYPTYKGGKVTEIFVYANYIGLRRFYRYVVNIGRWLSYEGGQLDRIHCNLIFICVRSVRIYNRRDIVHNVKLQNESLLSVVRHECSARAVSMAQLIFHLRKENPFISIFQKAPYITKLYIFLGLIPR